jgi:hypothetical protein
MSPLRFALVLVIALAGSAAADGRRLVVVVAKGSKLTNISKSDLKREFLGETLSDDDAPFVPFNAAPGTSERIGFDRHVLGMSPDEVGRYWVDRKVRGERGAPRSLPSPAHMAKVVAKFPHAIGYLPADQLTADIQPVSIDGISYTDARYSLTTN